MIRKNFIISVLVGVFIYAISIVVFLGASTYKNNFPLVMVFVLVWMITPFLLLVITLAMFHKSKLFLLPLLATLAVIIFCIIWVFMPTLASKIFPERLQESKFLFFRLPQIMISSAWILVAIMAWRVKDKEQYWPAGLLFALTIFIVTSTSAFSFGNHLIVKQRDLEVKVVQGHAQKIIDALEAYHQEHGKYPESVDKLNLNLLRAC